MMDKISMVIGIMVLAGFLSLCITAAVEKVVQWAREYNSID